jgi:acetyl esterase/lipase
MNRPLRTLLVLLLSVCAASAVAQAAKAAGPDREVAPEATGAVQPCAIGKTTFLYATRGAQELYLDRIVDTSVNVTGRRPVIIFSTGGGWEVAERYDRNSAPFFDYLASLGYVVVTIDYRLGMKQAKEQGELTPDNGVEMYLRAIEWGVEDLFDATAFVLRQADDWNIDPDQVVIMGSSAGATNSLVAEFNVANGTELALAHLPADFRYAAVIAMAGAFWLKADTPLTFKSKPAPIMFFHGAKDQLVTYDEVQGPFSGYGPAYYLREFAGPDYPKWFVDFPEGDHIVSFAPMMDFRLEMAAFLQKLVREHQPLSVHTVERAGIPKIFANFAKLYGDRMFIGAEAEPQE